MVYTIAGVAVVATGVGVVYLRTDPKTQNLTTQAPRPSKKERRKAKKEAQKASNREELGVEKSTDSESLGAFCSSSLEESSYARKY